MARKHIQPAIDGTNHLRTVPRQPEDRHVQLEVGVDLTPQELEERGKKLAEYDLKINELREEARAKAASYREQIKAIVEERDPLAKVVSTGKETRLTECVEKVDVERCRITVINPKTGAEISSRAIEPHERDKYLQGGLPFGSSDDDGDQAEA